MTANRNLLNLTVLTGLIAVVGGVGYWLGQQGSHGANTVFAGMVPEASSSGKSMSLATGVVEPGYESLFTLDHQTGDLTCWILNPKTGAVSSNFRVNVTSTMGLTAEPDFVMTTGYVDFSVPTDGALRAAKSVVYVADGNSGKGVGYVLMYNHNVLRGGPANGQLRPVCAFDTRTVGAIRNQGD